MKKTNTILIFIFSLFAVLFVIAAFIFFFKAIQNKNQHTSASLIVLSEKIKEKDDSVRFSGKIEEIKSFQNDINNYFVNTNKIDTFVDYLENFSKITGSEILVRSIEVSPEDENIISLKLSIHGTFDEISKTIILLENIPYQVNITQVYLNNEVNKDDTEKVLDIPEWQADLSFNILSQN